MILTPIAKPSMPNVVLVKVKDLAASQREWVAQMFGRQPGEDEEVSVMLFPAHKGPTPEQRQAAWKRIWEVLDKAAANARDVPEEEFEAAIEEAMAHVRSH